MLALTRYPEQRKIWWDDFAGVTDTAVEEVVRWASPVIYMRRTVTRDIELSGGVKMAEGDKVTMWYASANRDEEKFANPYLFDVTRTPNHHVGFGGGRRPLLPWRQPGPPRNSRRIRRTAPPHP